VSEAETQETHLGDGVYASFDGWYIWLAVERAGGRERVALEPQVFDALLGYAGRIWGDAR
jgi:hypothetical protein